MTIDYMFQDANEVTAELVTAENGLTAVYMSNGKEYIFDSYDEAVRKLEKNGFIF